MRRALKPISIQQLGCFFNKYLVFLSEMTMSVRDSKRRQRGKEEMAKSDPSNDVADDVIKDIVKGRTGNLT